MIGQGCKLKTVLARQDWLTEAGFTFIQNPAVMVGFAAQLGRLLESRFAVRSRAGYLLKILPMTKNLLRQE
jgi:hypothetical protein